tara:strand:+ start:159 stop:497 length:339 start_codon:yes stop_codon:yes gene_type:complete
MARKREIPNIEDALEKGFAELKVGEERISTNEATEIIHEDTPKPQYGLKIDAVENRGKFISNSINATKKTVEKPIEIKQLKREEDNQPAAVKAQKILDTPTSKVGDDFDVGW